MLLRLRKDEICMKGQGLWMVTSILVDGGYEYSKTKRETVRIFMSEYSPTLKRNITSKGFKYKVRA